MLFSEPFRNGLTQKESGWCVGRFSELWSHCLILYSVSEEIVFYMVKSGLLLHPSVSKTELYKGTVTPYKMVLQGLNCSAVQAAH